MPIEKRPANPIPKGTQPPLSKRHRVKDGENWYSVANDAGMDVWDLIDFNFKTRDPAEVNWYLRNNVGCVLHTPDGKNYRFSSAAAPGIIYLPAVPKPTPVGPKPTPVGPKPAPAKDDEIQTLSTEIGDFLNTESSLAWIDFYVGDTSRIHVTGAGLRWIGDRIKDRTIRVVVDDEELAQHGFYAMYKASNRVDETTGATIGGELVIASSAKHGEHFSGTWQAKYAIVHEAVHALLDARGRKILSIRSECAAYIAGVIYLRFAGIKIGSGWTGEYVQAAEIVDKFGLHAKLGIHLSSQDIRPLAKVVKRVYGHSWASREWDYDGFD
jgi:hypothetical protein